jgi:hypothetical protein
VLNNSPFFGGRRRVHINERKSAAQEIVGCEIHQDSRLIMAAADSLSHVDESTLDFRPKNMAHSQIRWIRAGPFYTLIKGQNARILRTAKSRIDRWLLLTR